ncbi:S1C family serine protease [Roseixanthobacter liquoris]|uniref:S1C family serine protease n=1 Tax=Roseixanthobacter liquoris TaxID=3119921 RepID=UPI00372C3E39
MLRWVRDRARWIALFAVLWLGWAGGAGQAQAGAALNIDEVIGKTRGWTIGLSTGMGGCIAAATYEDRTTVWMGFGSTKSKAFFGLSNPKWKSIVPGDQYELQLTARGEGRWRGDFKGVQLARENALLAEDLVREFVVDIARAGALYVIYGRKTIAQLSLSGSMAAIEALLDCQKDLAVAARAEGRPAEAAGNTGRDGSKSDEPKSSGTGFFVSERGYMLTNNHVVEGCKALKVVAVGDAARPAQLIARDATNDLALLKVDAAPKEVPALNPRPRVGDSVFVFGFPLSRLLASNGNFTVGNITAAAGLSDDTRMLQISAPVQPGNSGGPVLDQKGNIVGVVVSKLDALVVASAIKDIPQNVNFAIKSAIAQNFLDANGIETRSDLKDKALEPSAVADLAKNFTARIECR